MNQGKDETFLSRWSRRKAEVRQETAAPVPPAPSLALAADAPVAAAVPAANAMAAAAAPRDEPAASEPVGTDRATAPPPTLDEVKALTPASDFTRFVAPGVDAEVKNAAMKKLFSDPHFNIMDGLDTYIEDYGRADPIPKAMLRQMVQARVLGLLDDELEEQPQPADPVAPDAATSPQVATGTAPASGPQPDDAVALPPAATGVPPVAAGTAAAPASPPEAT